MSLFDGLPLEPPVEVPQPSSALRFTLTIKRASNGEEILLCSATPPPADALDEARSRKLPLFTLDEIPAMRQAAAADPAYIDNIIAARRIFGWGGGITYQGTV